MEPVNYANNRQSWLTLLPGWQFQLCCSRQVMFSRQSLCQTGTAHSKIFYFPLHFCQQRGIFSCLELFIDGHSLDRQSPMVLLAPGQQRMTQSESFPLA